LALALRYLKVGVAETARVCPELQPQYLPTVDSAQNRQTYTTFTINITSFVASGISTLVFTHGNWDCSVDDNVRNLQVRDSRNIILFSDPMVRILNCITSITYTFSPIQATFGVSAIPVASRPANYTAAASGGTVPYKFSWSFDDGSFRDRRFREPFVCCVRLS